MGSLTTVLEKWWARGGLFKNCNWLLERPAARTRNFRWPTKGPTPYTPASSVNGGSARPRSSPPTGPARAHFSVGPCCSWPASSSGLRIGMPASSIADRPWGFSYFLAGRTLGRRTDGFPPRVLLHRLLLGTHGAILRFRDHDLLWMAGLTLFILLEKVTPIGPRLGRFAGLALIGWGFWVLAGAIRWAVSGV